MNGLVTQLCIHCSSSSALCLICLSADLCFSPLRNTVQPRKALFLRVQSFWGSGLYQTPFLSPSSFSLFSRLLILNIYICLLLFLPLWSTRTRLTFCHFCTLTSLPTLRSFRLISSLLALSFITRSLTLESPLLSSSASVSITLTFSSFSLCFLNPKPINSV